MWAGFESTSIYVYCVYRPHNIISLAPDPRDSAPGIQPLLQRGWLSRPWNQQLHHITSLVTKRGVASWPSAI